MILKRPLIVGLTGSIGMGKSTISRMFARLGVPVFCADKAVHAFLSKGGAGVKPVSKVFPSCVSGDAINRKKLAAEIFEDKNKIKMLEDVLHPFVWKERTRFLNQAKRDKAQFVVCDIPLLFETGADKGVDVTICVSCKPSIQKARVMKRPAMTPKKFKAIMKNQMPDHEKRMRADIVLMTDKSMAQTRGEVLKIWRFLSQEGKSDA